MTEMEALVRESSCNLKRSAILVRNEDGEEAHLGRPWSEEILERFSEGEFNSSEYDVHVGPGTGNRIGPQDLLRIETVFYEGLVYHKSSRRTQRVEEDVPFSVFLRWNSPKSIRAKYKKEFDPSS